MSMLRRLNTRRFGTGFALFALGLQFLLSFGYIHSHLPVDYTHAHDFSRLLVDQPAPQIAADTQDSSRDQSGNAGTAHEHCTLCASIYLVGTLTPSQAPTLALALKTSGVLAPQETGFLISSVPYRLRYMRGPPTA